MIYTSMEDLTFQGRLISLRLGSHDTTLLAFYQIIIYNGNHGVMIIIIVHICFYCWCILVYIIYTCVYTIACTLVKSTYILDLKV